MANSAAQVGGQDQENTFEEQMLGKLKFKSALFEGVLDGGLDTLFAGSNKFKEMMEELSSTLSSTLEAPDEQPISTSDDEQQVMGGADSPQDPAEEAETPTLQHSPEHSISPLKGRDNNQQYNQTYKSCGQLQQARLFFLSSICLVGLLARSPFVRMRLLVPVHADNLVEPLLLVLPICIRVLPYVAPPPSSI